MHMKKAVIITILASAMFTHAAITDQLWSSLITTAPTLTGSEVDGDGSGWWCEVWNVTDSNYPVMSVGNTTPTTYGWLDAYGGYTLDTFDFTATETDKVVLRLYNASTVGGASQQITSAEFTLPDREAPIGGSDLDVAFDFSSSSWQAVPEPATFLLFGIGGVGAWLVRRKQRII
jgi:hypothetical protein